MVVDYWFLIGNVLPRQKHPVQAFPARIDTGGHRPADRLPRLKMDTARRMKVRSYRLVLLPGAEVFARARANLRKHQWKRAALTVSGGCTQTLTSHLRTVILRPDKLMRLCPCPAVQFIVSFELRVHDV
jgi:hypothetical protein